jgi:hypothetical protein
MKISFGSNCVRGYKVPVMLKRGGFVEGDDAGIQSEYLNYTINIIFIKIKNDVTSSEIWYKLDKI